MPCNYAYIKQLSTVFSVLPKIIYSSNFESTWLNMWPTIKHFIIYWTKRYLGTCYWPFQKHLRGNCNHTKK